MKIKKAPAAVLAHRNGQTRIAEVTCQLHNIIFGVLCQLFGGERSWMR